VVILGAIFIIVAFSSTPLIDLVSNSKSYLDKVDVVIQPILLEVQSYGVPPISFTNDTEFNPQKTIQTMLGIGMQFVVVILFSVFIVAGHEKQKLTHPILDQIDDELQKFISTKILISLILGSLVTGVLWLLGVKWAFAFGLLSFMLNFIPSIGPIVAALLPVPIALVEISPMMSLVVFGVMILIMGVVGFIIEVKLMGDMLKLHPLVVLMSLIFWGVLWGAAGVFLAIPMTVMIKIILAHYPNTKAMARLLAGHLPK
jgi:AI-2 transport protein TqsA